MKQITFTAILILAFCLAAFAQVSENSCPAIKLIGPAGITQPSEPVLYVAEIGKEAEKYNTEYIWTVRNGKIIEGQGTNSLKFLPDEGGSEMISTVTLEIKGLPKQCTNTFSENFYIFISPSSIQVDEYGKVPNGDEKARMDSFFVQLQNDPTAEGIIKVGNDKDLMRHLTFLSNYTRLRNFDRTRISFLIASGNEHLTQLWIIPAGAEMLDCDDCLIIKVEDFEKLQKLFQPNPTTKKRKK
jgi:hypothetical protein